MLLDVPATLGVGRLEPGQEITVDRPAGHCRGPGHPALRGRRRPGPLAAGGNTSTPTTATPTAACTTGVPGVSAAGATWLADHGVHAAGADTIAFELLAPGAGHGLLPAHRVLLVERGIYIIEAMDLEALAAAGVHEFLFVLSQPEALRRHRLPRTPARGGRRVSEPTLAQRLAAFAVSAARDGVPDDVGASVGQRILDVLGLCVAAHRLPTSAAAIGHVLDQGGHAQATVVGVPTRVTAAQAAFANGVLAHSLDYDDTHLPSVLHPSASVVPAALAAAEHAGASGEQTVRAIAVGLEVAVRLGMAGYDAELGNSVFFEHGQHATSICGAMGAAVAAAMLYGADEAGIVDALGVTASMASGIIEANRTGGTVKRMHCGWAAQAGVNAAQLVRRGFTGPPTVLEGRFGFFEAFLHGQFDPDEVTRGPRGHELGGAGHLLQALPGQPLHPHQRGRRPRVPRARDSPRRRRQHRDRRTQRGDPHHRPADRGQARTRRPATRRSSAARTPWSPVCSAAAGWAPAWPTTATSWPATRQRRALMALVDVDARRAVRRDLPVTSSRPSSRSPPPPARRLVEEVLTNRGGPGPPARPTTSSPPSSATTSPDA